MQSCKLPAGGAYSAQPVVFKRARLLLSGGPGKRDRRAREGKKRGRERKGSGPQILWPRTAPECDFISLVEGLGVIVTDNPLRCGEVGRHSRSYLFSSRRQQHITTGWSISSSHHPSSHAACCGDGRRSRSHVNVGRRRTATNITKIAHTRLPSVGFRSRSRFLAVSLQVT